MGYSDKTRCLRRFRLGTDTSVLAEESESLPIEIVSSSESNLNGATLVSEPVGVEKPSGRNLSQGVCNSCRCSEQLCGWAGAQGDHSRRACRRRSGVPCRQNRRGRCYRYMIRGKGVKKYR